MTALTKFQRLEAQGWWRAHPDAAVQEVIVSLGDATLVLSDPVTDQPLSHWSLPAVVRLNPGTIPAVYAPGPEGTDETVSVEDPLMTDAIARVQGAIATHRAHTGRLRSVLAVVAVLGVMAGLLLWLPGAIVTHAARIAPPAQARDIGMAILSDLERDTGAICQRESGQAVLDWLAQQLLPPDAALRAVPGPLGGARRLPGDIYLLGGDLLQNASGPEAAAAHLVAAHLASRDDDLRLAALRHAGLWASLRLMTLGHIPPQAMQGYADTILLQPAPRPRDDLLLTALAEQSIPAEPYARSLDPTGRSVQQLIEGDATRNAAAARPLLSDEQWLALQQICAG